MHHASEADDICYSLASVIALITAPVTVASADLLTHLGLPSSQIPICVSGRLSGGSLDRP